MCKTIANKRFINQNLVSFIIGKLLKHDGYAVTSYKYQVSTTKISTPFQMHILQPKHIKLKEKEEEEILSKFNLSKSQLPKILSNDPALPEDCRVGDIIKIERKEGDKINIYYRVIV